MTLSNAGEFALIDAMRERWGALAVDIGDDAAVIDLPRGERLVASTDAVIDRVHFRREWVTDREIGYRGVTAALSDLAAMAASPLGVLVAIQLPAALRDALLPLADGIGDAARAGGTVIRGGNLAAGDALSITTTVIGSAYAPLARSAARPGDTLYVTGGLGGPAAALRSLIRGAAAAAEHRARLASPAARIPEARWLAAHGATAAIDISDGLSADAAHLAEASGIAVEIDVDRIPILAGATEADALGGGEEYELVVTAPSLDVAAFERRFSLSLTAIGRITAGPGELRLVRAGQRVAAPMGHDHFSR